jgi:hypothetical protein
LISSPTLVLLLPCFLLVYQSHSFFTLLSHGLES